MKRTILSLLLAAVTFTIHAVEATVNGICFITLDDSHAKVIVHETWDDENKCMIRDDYKGTLTIPSSVQINDKTYTVTSIYIPDCPNLTTVNLPNTLEEISLLGFDGCTGLTGIVLPSSLKKIGLSAFQNCPKLTEIRIPASVREIGNAAFCTYGDSLKITLTDLKAWLNVEIEEIIFNSNTTIFLNDEMLKKVVIPDGIKIIKPNAFRGFKDITSVHIPASVDSIGDDAFLGCTSISKVSTDDIASWCGIHFATTSFMMNGGSPIRLANPVGYSQNLYIGNTSIDELTIPEGVDSIGCAAFVRIKGLTTVNLPSTLRYVGPDAFLDCTDLRIVNIKSIQDYCQIYFASLGSSPFQDYIVNRNAFTWLLVNGKYVHDDKRILYIPNGITEVKANAFANADPTETVIIPASVTKIGTNAFRNSVMNRFHTLCIKGHIEEMGELAFGSCPYISTIYIEDENPSEIPANTFTNYYYPQVGTLGSDYNYKHTKLMVPTGCKTIYEGTAGWNLFENIEEFDVAAVHGIGMSTAVTTQYTLDGRIASPDYKGIVLERMPDGSVRKVIKR